MIRVDELEPLTNEELRGLALGWVDRAIRGRLALLLERARCPNQADELRALDPLSEETSEQLRAALESLSRRLAELGPRALEPDELEAWTRASGALTCVTSALKLAAAWPLDVEAVSAIAASCETVAGLAGDAGSERELQQHDLASL